MNLSGGWRLQFNVECRFILYLQSSHREPLPLEPAANSIVCTDDAMQLLQLFNQQHVPVSSPVRVPSRRCSMSQVRCERCLNDTRCQTQGASADDDTAVT